MAQYGWDTCPNDLREQIVKLVTTFQEIIQDDLIGIYLHGSLAMDCFNPDRSDIDLLVVVREAMTVETKRRLIELLLVSSRSPYPIEISFLAQHDLHPWRHPTPFDLHFSESWRGRYERELAGGQWSRWNEEGRTDGDLAAHVMVTQKRGVTLWGESSQHVFPEVPAADYLASIMSDAEDAARRIEEMPVYAVLNLCRVYLYLSEGRVSSKEEGGVWGASYLPAEDRDVVLGALAAYQGDAPDDVFDPAALRSFTQRMAERLGLAL